VIEASLFIALVSVLLVFIALQQFFFLHQINKLVDKVMSRSYTEYVKAKEPTQRPSIQIPTEPLEDLRTLQEFQL
jgi:hypothetical protein